MRFRWPWSGDPPPSEGTLARIEAERNLAEHKAQRIEVREVSQSLRSLRIRNHFSEQIQGLIEGRERQ